jgi:hypothetical protein
MARLEDFDPLQRPDPVPVTGDDEAGERPVGRPVRLDRAVDAAAFPAPTTIVRPRGGCGRLAGIALSETLRQWQRQTYDEATRARSYTLLPGGVLSSWDRSVLPECWAVRARPRPSLTQASAFPSPIS